MNTSDRVPSIACSVRQYLPGDEAGILRLLNGTALKGDSLIYRFEDLAGLKAAYGKLAIWAAELNGEIVGTTTGAIKEVLIGGVRKKIGHVFNLRISSDVRRLGVANLLSDANRTWMLGNGVTAGMCLVGAENLPSLGFVTSVGYREAGRVRFIRILRQSNSCNDQLVCPVDLNKDTGLRTRVMERFENLDLCPVGLTETLYKTTQAGYLGTLYVETSEGPAFGSVWDKNAALNRTTLEAKNSTLFMYDIVVNGVKGIEALVRSAFAAYPQTNRIVLVLNESSSEVAAVTETIAAFPFSSYTECIMTRGVNVDREAYVDVRD